MAKAAKSTKSLEDDFPLAAIFWRIERWGWALMGLFLAAALLGLLGRGFLSGGRAAAPDGSLAVRYERVLRWKTAAPLRISVRAAPPEGRVGLSIGLDYLDGLELRSIIPEPKSLVPREDALALDFDAAPGEPLEIIIEAAPSKIGRRWGSIALSGGRGLRFRQLVII